MHGSSPKSCFDPSSPPVAVMQKHLWSILFTSMRSRNSRIMNLSGTRLFHLIKNWKCCITIDLDKTEFHLHVPRAEYIMHLLRRILLLHGGFVGTPMQTPTVRILDVRQDTPDDTPLDSFGPHFVLNHVTEQQVLLALRHAVSPNFYPYLTQCFPALANKPYVQQLSESGLRLSTAGTAIFPPTAFAQAYEDSIRKTFFIDGESEFQALVILCWIVPASARVIRNRFGRSAQRLILLQSLLSEFHHTLRVSPSTTDRFRIVTSSYIYDDLDEQIGLDSRKAAERCDRWCSEVRHRFESQNSGQYNSSPNTLDQRSVYQASPESTLFMLPTRFWRDSLSRCAEQEERGRIHLSAVVFRIPSQSRSLDAAVYECTNDFVRSKLSESYNPPPRGIDECLHPAVVDAFIQRIMESGQ